MVVRKQEKDFNLEKDNIYLRITMKIKIFNKISKNGISYLENNNVLISDEENYDAILVRSSKLHDQNFPSSLKAIGRAGAGVNNIPVDKCTSDGIVVFNTPGANANAVKELVLTGLFLSCRDILGGINFAKSLKDEPEEQIQAKVESSKSNFKGFEVKGKRLGVIGLGAIGVLVANDALNLGLKVSGYDPFISVDRAWGLSSSVDSVQNINRVLSESDFITLHMPYTKSTHCFLNEERVDLLKHNSVVLNFARPEIVDEDAILKGLDNGKISRYITDFPSQKLLCSDKVIPIPHLGASTKEAEENCAIMIAEQVYDFLKNGNIRNSVNFPNCSMDRSGSNRIVIANKNIPNMVGQITGIIAANDLNICEMVNKSRDEVAYNILDVNGEVSDSILDQFESVDGVIFARLI